MPRLTIRAALQLYPADLALAAVFADRGLTHFLVPDTAERSLLAKQLPPWDHAWAALWLLGPLLILAGAWCGRDEGVAMGWTLMGCGMALNLVALVALQPSDPRSYLNVPLLLLGAWRLVLLRRAFLRRTVPARER